MNKPGHIVYLSLHGKTFDIKGVRPQWFKLLIQKKKQIVPLCIYQSIYKHVYYCILCTIKPGSNVQMTSMTTVCMFDVYKAPQYLIMSDNV